VSTDGQIAVPLHAALGWERVQRKFENAAAGGGGQRYTASTSYPCSRIGQGSLNQIHGNYQHAIRILPHQYSFRSIQRSATDSHPLARFEKGITFEGNFTPQEEFGRAQFVFPESLFPARRFPQNNHASVRSHRSRSSGPYTSRDKSVAGEQGTIPPLFARSLHSRTWLEKAGRNVIMPWFCSCWTTSFRDANGSVRYQSI